MRKFKYTLDRKSLETIYITFIRPILEYADIIWDNCTQQEKNDLEKIQLEAARIATGATKLVSIENLYHETGWEKLETRRKNHKLTLFYKMFNNISPTYLSSLVPQLVQNVSNYNLRNADDIRTIYARTRLYSNSFLPSTIRDWNNLPRNVRDVDTVDSFKRHLSQGRANVPKYYYSGSRRLQVLHTRLRTGCSSLKYDLCAKNIVNSPLCDCRSGAIENADHFFLRCHLYREHRVALQNSILQYSIFNLNVILKGDENLSYETNVSIFESVHKYIQNTNRF